MIFLQVLKEINQPSSSYNVMETTALLIPYNLSLILFTLKCNPETETASLMLTLFPVSFYLLQLISEMATCFVFGKMRENADAYISVYQITYKTLLYFYWVSKFVSLSIRLVNNTFMLNHLYVEFLIFCLNIIVLDISTSIAIHFLEVQDISQEDQKKFMYQRNIAQVMSVVNRNVTKKMISLAYVS